MHSCRRGLSAAIATLALSMGGARAYADDAKPFVPPPPGLPNSNSPALNLAWLDFVTAEIAAGGIGAFDHSQGGSTELMAGFVAARIEFLGLSVSGATFRAAYRPTLDTGVLSGTLVSLDEMMFGSRYPDLPVCPGLPNFRCDQTSGYWGFGLTGLSFATDLGNHRSAIRAVEGDFVGSVTPAFGPDWKRVRFLPRIGASVDWVSRSITGNATWIGRGMLGFDSSFAAGPIFIRPSFRWRPSTSAFVHDYTLEPHLDIFAREAWAAVHDRDAIRIGGEIGFTHTSEPDNAFGPDLVGKAENTFFARVVLSPSFFTFGPP